MKRDYKKISDLVMIDFNDNIIHLPLGLHSDIQYLR